MHDRSLRAVALVALALGTLAARLPKPAGTPLLGPPAPAALPSTVVLQRYVAALATLARPKVISFDYTVEQLGLRNLEQTHRVYRSGLHERDETLLVDGYTLMRPAIRIFNNRTYRYDVTSVAPRPAAYAFGFAGTIRAASGFAYVYRTAPRATGSFAVSEVQIDGRTFLPSVVRFKIAGGGARGSGSLQYQRSDRFWVVREAQVNVRVRSGSPAHERIVWSNYRFPVGLPPSTFEAPHAVATKGPGAPF